MSSEEVAALLKESGAVLLRKKKHPVWRLPDGQRVTIGNTPSDSRSSKNELARIRRMLDMGGPLITEDEINKVKNYLTITENPKATSSIADAAKIGSYHRCLRILKKLEEKGEAKRFGKHAHSKWQFVKAAPAIKQSTEQEPASPKEEIATKEDKIEVLSETLEISTDNPIISSACEVQEQKADDEVNNILPSSEMITISRWNLLKTVVDCLDLNTDSIKPSTIKTTMDWIESMK